MNAEQPKARHPGEVQRHGELSVAYKLRKRQTQAVSWTANVYQRDVDEKIKIKIVDVGQIWGEIQMQGYEVAKLNPEVMRSKKTIRSYHV